MAELYCFFLVWDILKIPQLCGLKGDPISATNPVTERDPAKAIIVGIQLPGEDSEVLRDELNELEGLLTTLQISAEGRLIQRRQKLSPSCLIGTGKVAELKEVADSNGAGVIVFDRPLSGPQVRNLEEQTGCKVLDRHGVILEIFARHAKTNQAKTQVEIAKLEYMLPRLAGAWTHFQRQSGGHVSRGMGEKQIEIDRRRVKERISRLRGQLDQIAREREVQRKSRRGELKVALVGYTNSGKTTLMKGLTRAQVEGRDELFATLDSQVKLIDPSTRPKILLSDTVGFIRNLPHSLVDSFRSTLDEVREADLLLLVVDASHDHYADQLRVTREVLDEIGAGDIPQILVFNKMDRVDDPFFSKVLRGVYPGSICVSAQNAADSMTLRNFIYDFFERHFVKASVDIPLSDASLLSFIYNFCKILDVDYEAEGRAVFDICTTKSSLAKLSPFIKNGAL